MWEESDGVTRVVIPFKPSGSVFVVFRERAEKEDHLVSLKRDGRLVLPVPPGPRPKIKVLRASYGELDDSKRTRDVREKLQRLGETGVQLFSMELVPRISRAQHMDALSSPATIAGYGSVMMAASRLPKIFPMLTTAAGTLSPARVLVIGAGVAGLQAIATSKRLGAIIQAYDVRPAARDDVESVGAKLLQLPLEPGDAEDRLTNNGNRRRTPLESSCGHALAT